MSMPRATWHSHKNSRTRPSQRRDCASPMRSMEPIAARASLWFPIAPTPTRKWGGFERVRKNRVDLSDAPAAVAPELDGSAPVSPALNQDLEDLAVVIATARQRYVRLPKKARFARDSPLEGDGFEPSVPHKKQAFLAAPVRSRNSPSTTKTGSFVPGTDGSNPSPSSRESMMVQTKIVHSEILGGLLVPADGNESANRTD
jgi:hypothetical protein